MIRIEIKSVFGKVLFVHEAVDNTIKNTLEQANLHRVNLYGADLHGANLRGSNLYGASLRGSNLRRTNLHGACLYGADLYGSDLRGAYLHGSNLRRTNLRGADLSGVDLHVTDLHGADLYGADLHGADLSLYCKWNVSYKIDGSISIGCKTKTIAEWDIWFSGVEEFETPRCSEDFKRIYANYVAVREYIKIING